MKITTNRKIINLTNLPPKKAKAKYNSVVYGDYHSVSSASGEEYYNAFGGMTKNLQNIASKTQNVSSQQKGQGFLGNLINKGQGLFGGGLLGGLSGKGNQPTPPPLPPPPPPPRKGMSKGLKIGLIVGGSVLALTLIGLLIYKSGKSGKSK